MTSVFLGIQEVSRVCDRHGLECPHLPACPQGNVSGPDICLQEGVLRKSLVLTSASDFYPRFVIKNMFKNLIICIFPSELTR